MRLCATSSGFLTPSSSVLSATGPVEQRNELADCHFTILHGGGCAAWNPLTRATRSQWNRALGCCRTHLLSCAPHLLDHLFRIGVLSVVGEADVLIIPPQRNDAVAKRHTGGAAAQFMHFEQGRCAVADVQA